MDGQNTSLVKCARMDASVNMLKYIISLAKKHTNEIGFIPRVKVEEYVNAGQVFLATENDEPCGFLLFGSGYPRLRIFQACVQYDAQRRAHGLDMVGRLIARADAQGYDAISLWCAEDLQANEFWKAAGFQLAQSKPGGKRRGRRLNLWIYWLPRQRLFEQPEAGQKAEWRQEMERVNDEP